MNKIKLDPFIISLLGVLILAFLFPQIGTSTHPINLQQLSGYGITIIFFFYGLKLSPKKFTQGLGNWRMHVIIQVTTFIIFPLLVILIKPLFSDFNIWLSIFFLSALPSTVSTSVVMVSLAKGNVPAAIFNATISSFGGIFITPVWMGLFMKMNTVEFDSVDIITKLIFQILVPIIIGSVLHFKFGEFAEKHNSKLKKLDQSIVLLIVFTSFCKSVESGILQSISISTILAIIIGMVVLFFVVFFLLRFVSKQLHFSYQDSVATIFCGSKKSLVHGVVVSKVLFSGNPIIGLILVPLMIYHSLQLIIVGLLVNKMGKIIGK